MTLFSLTLVGQDEGDASNLNNLQADGGTRENVTEAAAMDVFEKAPGVGAVEEGRGPPQPAELPGPSTRTGRCISARALVLGHARVAILVIDSDMVMPAHTVVHQTMAGIARLHFRKACVGLFRSKMCFV